MLLLLINKHLLLKGQIKTIMKNITQTITFKMVNDEARQLSWKLQNTIYVIQRGNSLFSTMAKEEGKVLSIWKFGNNII